MTANGTLVRLPCVDDESTAEAARSALWIDRGRAAELGRSALEIVQARGYEHPPGRWIDLSGPIERSLAARRSLPPEAPLPEPPGGRFQQTTVQVRNETTFEAARRLVDDGRRTVALNFANGLHPGGGFLNGARAQEEVLCRSSGLFDTLQGDPMYQAHAQRPLPDSSAWSIYSPDVPVFRDDAGAFLDAPWLLSFITCAAPYAPTVGQPESGDLLAERIPRILEIAHCFGFEALVLGAWGCGAFENDPVRTACDFRTALEGPFAGCFREVVFAIVDWSPERRILGPFRDAFAP
ncbi:MAG: TIGR02452 family protein [Pseudomonadales bacterium]|jgi:uncharacterized protein (TIGR02452 family)|nr:TIGR02452 family protein [Pseudomonadales bacterium]